MQAAGAALLLACLALCRAQSANLPVTVTATPEEAPAPSCFKPGITAVFYDLSQGQAQYLAGEFPFKSGPGELLDTLKPADVLLLPKINFGSGKLESIKGDLVPWPRKFPAKDNGTIATFDAELLMPMSGFWTFFLTSSSPVEMTLSQNGTSEGVLKSGDELEVNATAIEGTVHQIQFDILNGTYQLHVEWHAGLPGDPIKDRLLVLEWSFQSDPTRIPSPSPAVIPRQVIDAKSFSTLCSTTPASGPATAKPRFPSPPPKPRDPSPPPVNNLSLLGPSYGTPPSYSSAAQPPAYASFSCGAAYTITNTYKQGAEFRGSLNLYLTVAGTSVPVPFTVRISNPGYTAVGSTYNFQVTSPLQSGVVSGIASDAWETLTPRANPINIGGDFAAASDNLVPATLSINGVACVLRPY